MSCCTEIDGEPVEFLCPTLYIAQKWLRENKKLHIEISYMYGDYWTYDILTISEHDLVGLSDRPIIHYKSYEEALEAGIQEALNLYESKPNIFLAIFIISALFIGHFRLTFSPFSVSFPYWHRTVGVVLIVAGCLVYNIGERVSGYKRGLDEGMEIVLKELKKDTMKKIMFNDKYSLPQAVLDGRKTMTRRVCKYDRPNETYDIVFPVLSQMITIMTEHSISIKLCFWLEKRQRRLYGLEYSKI